MNLYASVILGIADPSGTGLAVVLTFWLGGGVTWHFIQLPVFCFAVVGQTFPMHGA
jgi:hypothetical protein